MRCYGNGGVDNCATKADDLHKCSDACGGPTDCTDQTCMTAILALGTCVDACPSPDIATFYTAAATCWDDNGGTACMEGCVADHAIPSANPVTMAFFDCADTCMTTAYGGADSADATDASDSSSTSGLFLYTSLALLLVVFLAMF